MTDTYFDDLDEPVRITEPLRKLSRDLVRAATTMSEREVRYLVDSYYLIQGNRKRADNQIRAMEDEPHEVLTWLGDNNEMMEAQIKRALQSYAQSHPVGQWLMSIFGIGPVISAGLLAHVDINEAPTAGHIWSFAGFNPEQSWGKGEKRPWNAGLKTLCWHAGQSFMKFSNVDGCWYGKMYRKRKDAEVARNESGANAQAAATILTEKNFDKTTDAYAALIEGKLPKAQVDARARRYVVKLWLSHLHLVWTWLVLHKLPPKPYAIVHKGHAHFIPPPDVDQIEGLAEEMRKEGWN
jgi:Transposase IS116/IS110/IS902 family